MAIGVCHSLSDHELKEPVLGYSAFKISNQAMSPALEPRDVVLVDTCAFSSRSPEIGEVIVIRKPDTNRSYIRRVSTRPIEGAVTVVSDQSLGVSAESQTLTVPLSEVVGQITYVMYSRDNARIGQRVR
jgi:signal peptidase I